MGLAAPPGVPGGLAAGDGEAAPGLRVGLGVGLAVLPPPSPPHPPIEKASIPIVAKYKSLRIAIAPKRLTFKLSKWQVQLLPFAAFKFTCV